MKKFNEQNEKAKKNANIKGSSGEKRNHVVYL